MQKQKYTYAQLGMLFGIFVGGGLGTVLFVSTGNAVYFTFVGVGVGFGLALGAGFDRKQGE